MHTERNLILAVFNICCCVGPVLSSQGREPLIFKVQLHPNGCDFLLFVSGKWNQLVLRALLRDRSNRAPNFFRFLSLCAILAQTHIKLLYSLSGEWEMHCLQ